MALFKALPREIHDNILLNIEDLRDKLAYGSLCRETRDAMRPTSRFWSMQYREEFEPSPGIKVEEGPHAEEETCRNSFLVYRYRKIYLDPKLCRFRWGKAETESQFNTLCVLRDLIIDSFSRPKDGRSLNQERIMSLCYHSNFLDHDLNVSFFRAASSLMLAIQTCLLPLKFALGDEDLVKPTRFLFFEESQNLVFRLAAASEPLFKRTSQETHESVDMAKLLHLGNYFKHQLTGGPEDVDQWYREDFAKDQRIKLWSSAIENGATDIMGRWCLCVSWEVDSTRDDHTSGIDRDSAITGFGIQELEVDREDSSKMRDMWPKFYEAYLLSLKHPTLMDVEAGSRMASKHGVRSLGSNRIHSSDPRHANKNEKPSRLQQNGLVGPYREAPSTDVKTFFSSGDKHSKQNYAFVTWGWVTPMPIQEGIPGWCRVTMIELSYDKTRYDKQQALEMLRSGQVAEDDFYDDDLDEARSWYAFEGCMLPGGQLMLGRWWNLHASFYESVPGHQPEGSCGPYIAWKAD